MLATSAILLILGLAAGYRELGAVAGAGLLAVLLAACWTGLPPRLEVDRRMEPQRVGRGDFCRALIDLHTASRRTRTLSVTDRISGPAGVRIMGVPPIRVRGGVPARTGYELPTDRRGLLTVGPVRVARRDLFGLCGVDRAIGGTAQLLVRPRWHPLRGVPTGVSRSLDGVADTALHGSITFHTLREYQIGDDLRQVHWRTSARIGALMVREHIDTALPALLLLVDDRAESYVDDPSAVEEAIEAAASILVASGRDGLPVVLRLASGASAATSSVAAAGAGLDLLAQVQLVAGVDLPTTLRLHRAEQPGETLVFVTGPATDLRAVLAVRNEYAQVVVVILGATAAPPPAEVTVVLAATAAEFAHHWNGMLR
ncbi:DUF58 domain-containing protein [Dactylosporangium sp. NPDC050688]|uniref:DUF58 domain-containing protein n=1 Tax=Dactylosporangium sp. NPDC050688 TaxID=3157217 RepID=UPI0033D0E4B6